MRDNQKGTIVDRDFAEPILQLGRVVFGPDRPKSITEVFDRIFSASDVAPTAGVIKTTPPKTLPTDIGASLQLDAYQQGAKETAIFPRVWTEDQVKAIIRKIVPDWVAGEDLPFDQGYAVMLEEDIEETLAEFEQPFNKLVYPMLGLLGEAGEMANKLKKIARDGKVMDLDAIEDSEKELGDVLWYIAMLADGLGTRLGKIGRKNLLKLASRQQRGVLGGSGDNR